MPELLNSEQEPRTIIPPESGELLESKLKDAASRENSKAVHMSEAGAQKDAAEMFGQIREKYKSDSESGLHHEAGEPLPVEAKDNVQKIEIINKWLMDPSDPDAMTKFLQDNIN